MWVVSGLGSESESIPSRTLPPCWQRFLSFSEKHRSCSEHSGRNSDLQSKSEAPGHSVTSPNCLFLKDHDVFSFLTTLLMLLLLSKMSSPPFLPRRTPVTNSACTSLLLGSDAPEIFPIPTISSQVLYHHRYHIPLMVRTRNSLSEGRDCFLLTSVFPVPSIMSAH